MSGDLVSLAHEVSPYVTAAVSAYGAAVLARAQEDAADATVGWGRRILQRIFGIQSEEDAAPDVVAELADDPENTDLQAALRVQIRQLLTADPQLAAEVAQMVAQARNQVAVGQGQVNAQASGNAQQANQGQGTMNVSFGAQRDQSTDR